jgi:hypothetical protein
LIQVADLAGQWLVGTSSSLAACRRADLMWIGRPVEYAFIHELRDSDKVDTLFPHARAIRHIRTTPKLL